MNRRPLTPLSLSLSPSLSLSLSLYSVFLIYCFSWFLPRFYSFQVGTMEVIEVAVRNEVGGGDVDSGRGQTPQVLPLQ